MIVNRLVRYALIFLGIVVFIDGLGSILVYWHQTWIEHLVRVLRMVDGIAVAWLSAKW